MAATASTTKSGTRRVAPRTSAPRVIIRLAEFQPAVFIMRVSTTTKTPATAKATRGQIPEWRGGGQSGGTDHGPAPAPAAAAARLQSASVRHRAIHQQNKPG